MHCRGRDWARVEYRLRVQTQNLSKGDHIDEVKTAVLSRNICVYSHLNKLDYISSLITQL
jgi:hypothetical protein